MTQQLRTAKGPVPAAYLDGGEFSSALDGVFFEIRCETGRLVCKAAHPESSEHLLQYAPPLRAHFFSKAAEVAAHDCSNMYAPCGSEAWAAGRIEHVPDPR